MRSNKNPPCIIRAQLSQPVDLQSHLLIKNEDQDLPQVPKLFDVQVKLEHDISNENPRGNKDMSHHSKRKSRKRDTEQSGSISDTLSDLDEQMDKYLAPLPNHKPIRKDIAKESKLRINERFECSALYNPLARLSTKPEVFSKELEQLLDPVYDTPTQRAMPNYMKMRYWLTKSIRKIPYRRPHRIVSTEYKRSQLPQTLQSFSGLCSWQEKTINEVVISLPMTLVECARICAQKLSANSIRPPFGASLKTLADIYTDVEFFEVNSSKPYMESMEELAGNWPYRGTAVVCINASDCAHACIFMHSIGTILPPQLYSDTYYGSLFPSSLFDQVYTINDVLLPHTIVYLVMLIILAWIACRIRNAYSTEEMNVISVEGFFASTGRTQRYSEYVQNSSCLQLELFKDLTSPIMTIYPKEGCLCEANSYNPVDYVLHEWKRLGFHLGFCDKMFALQETSVYGRILSMCACNKWIWSFMQMVRFMDTDMEALTSVPVSDVYDDWSVINYVKDKNCFLGGLIFVLTGKIVRSPFRITDIGYIMDFIKAQGWGLVIGELYSKVNLDPEIIELMSVKDVIVKIVIATSEKKNGRTIAHATFYKKNATQINIDQTIPLVKKLLHEWKVGVEPHSHTTNTVRPPNIWASKKFRRAMMLCGEKLSAYEADYERLRLNGTKFPASNANVNLILRLLKKRKANHMMGRIVLSGIQSALRTGRMVEFMLAIKDQKLIVKLRRVYQFRRAERVNHLSTLKSIKNMMRSLMLNKQTAPKTKTDIEETKLWHAVEMLPALGKDDLKLPQPTGNARPKIQYCYFEYKTHPDQLEVMFANYKNKLCHNYSETVRIWGLAPKYKKCGNFVLVFMYAWFKKDLVALAAFRSCFTPTAKGSPNFHPDNKTDYVKAMQEMDAITDAFYIKYLPALKQIADPTLISKPSEMRKFVQYFKYGMKPVLCGPYLDTVWDGLYVKPQVEDSLICHYVYVTAKDAHNRPYSLFAHWMIDMPDNFTSEVRCVNDWKFDMTNINLVKWEEKNPRYNGIVVVSRQVRALEIALRLHKPEEDILTRRTLDVALTSMQKSVTYVDNWGKKIAQIGDAPRDVWLLDAYKDLKVFQMVPLTSTYKLTAEQVGQLPTDISNIVNYEMVHPGTPVPLSLPIRKDLQSKVFTDFMEEMLLLNPLINLYSWEHDFVSIMDNIYAKKIGTRSLLAKEFNNRTYPYHVIWVFPKDVKMNTPSKPLIDRSLRSAYGPPRRYNQDVQYVPKDTPEKDSAPHYDPEPPRKFVKGKYVNSKSGASNSFTEKVDTNFPPKSKKNKNNQSMHYEDPYYIDEDELVEEHFFDEDDPFLKPPTEEVDPLADMYDDGMPVTKKYQKTQRVRQQIENKKKTRQNLPKKPKVDAVPYIPMKNQSSTIAEPLNQAMIIEEEEEKVNASPVQVDKATQALIQQLLEQDYKCSETDEKLEETLELISAIEKAEQEVVERDQLALRTIQMMEAEIDIKPTGVLAQVDSIAIPKVKSAEQDRAKRMLDIWQVAKGNKNGPTATNATMWDLIAEAILAEPEIILMLCEWHKEAVWPTEELEEAFDKVSKANLSTLEQDFLEFRTCYVFNAWTGLYKLFNHATPVQKGMMVDAVIGLMKLKTKEFEQVLQQRVNGVEIVRAIGSSQPVYVVYKVCEVLPQDLPVYMTIECDHQRKKLVAYTSNLKQINDVWSRAFPLGPRQHLPQINVDPAGRLTTYIDHRLTVIIEDALGIKLDSLFVAEKGIRPSELRPKLMDTIAMLRAPVIHVSVPDPQLEYDDILYDYVESVPKQWFFSEPLPKSEILAIEPEPMLDLRSSKLKKWPFHVLPLTTPMVISYTDDETGDLDSCSLTLRNFIVIYENVLRVDYTLSYPDADVDRLGTISAIISPADLLILKRNLKATFNIVMNVKKPNRPPAIVIPPVNSSVSFADKPTPKRKRKVVRQPPKMRHLNAGFPQMSKSRPQRMSAIEELEMESLSSISSDTLPQWSLLMDERSEINYTQAEIVNAVIAFENGRSFWDQVDDYMVSGSTVNDICAALKLKKWDTSLAKKTLTWLGKLSNERLRSHPLVNIIIQANVRIFPWHFEAKPKIQPVVIGNRKHVMTKLEVTNKYRIYLAQIKRETDKAKYEDENIAEDILHVLGRDMKEQMGTYRAKKASEQHRAEHALEEEGEEKPPDHPKHPREYMDDMDDRCRSYIQELDDLEQRRDEEVLADRRGGHFDDTYDDRDNGYAAEDAWERANKRDEGMEITEKDGYVEFRPQRGRGGRARGRGGRVTNAAETRRKAVWQAKVNQQRREYEAYEYAQPPTGDKPVNPEQAWAEGKKDTNTRGRGGRGRGRGNNKKRGGKKSYKKPVYPFNQSAYGKSLDLEVSRVSSINRLDCHKISPNDNSYPDVYARDNISPFGAWVPVDNGSYLMLSPPMKPALLDLKIARDWWYFEDVAVAPSDILPSAYLDGLFGTLLQRPIVHSGAKVKGCWVPWAMRALSDYLYLKGVYLDERRWKDIPDQSYIKKIDIPIHNARLVLSIRKSGSYISPVMESVVALNISNNFVTNPWGLPMIASEMIRHDSVITFFPISGEIDLVCVSDTPELSCTITLTRDIVNFFIMFMNTEYATINAPGFDMKKFEARSTNFFAWKSANLRVMDVGYAQVAARFSRMVTQKKYVADVQLIDWEVRQMTEPFHRLVRQMMECTSYLSNADVQMAYDMMYSKGTYSPSTCCQWFFIPSITEDLIIVDERIKALTAFLQLFDGWDSEYQRRMIARLKLLEAKVIEAQGLSCWSAIFITSRIDELQAVHYTTNSEVPLKDMLAAFKLLYVLRLKFDPSTPSTLCDFFRYAEIEEYWTPFDVFMRMREIEPRALWGIQDYRYRDYEAPFYRPVPQPREAYGMDHCEYNQGDIIDGAEITPTDNWFDTLAAPNRTLRRVKFFTKHHTRINDQREFVKYLLSIKHEEKAGRPFHVTGVIGETEPTKPRNPVVTAFTALNSFRALITRQAGTRAIEDPFIKQVAEKFFKKEARKIADKMENYWSEHPLTTPEEYIATLDPARQKIYAAGLKKWHETGKVPLDMYAVMKTNEASYPNPDLEHDQVRVDVRPRLIFNPSEQVKVLIGWLNYNYIQATKHTSKEFVHGTNLSELEARMEQQLHDLGEDTAFVAWDGSGHDSHQHAWWIDSVDNQIHKRLIPFICAKLGYPPHLAKELLTFATALDLPFTMLYPRTRTPMVTGRVYGTVFSGNAIRTTWGNTIRVILFAALAQKIARLGAREVKLNVSGDDAEVLVVKRKIEAYMAAIRMITVDEQRMGGIGYLLKKIDTSSRVIDFLSKNGVVLPNGQISISRIFERFVLGGNIFNGVTKSISVEQHAWAVTQGLIATQGMSLPFKSYVDYRISHLKLAKSNDANIMDKIDVERKWKAMSAAHPDVDPEKVYNASLYYHGTPYDVYQEYMKNSGFYSSVRGIVYHD